MGKLISNVFMSGRSQAVRIPKALRFDADEVYIEKDGDKLILIPKPKSWDHYFESSQTFSDDYPDNVDDVQPEERDTF